MQYFQFELQKIPLTVNGVLTEFISLTIESVTHILKYQQRISDEIYQDAIEANYSHEQMTPLNSILGNSTNLISDFIEFSHSM